MNKLALAMVAVFLFYFCQSVSAHEGHDVPGSVPPAPNGGRVEEAHDKVEHSKHETESESEIFFEVLYKGKEIKIFPLQLPETDRSTFKAVSIKELANTSVTIEFPRTKVTEKFQLRPSDTYYFGTVDPKKNKRFIVHISTFYKNELKQTSIQIEKE